MQQHKVLIFGASGQVGSHVIEQALMTDYEVQAFVRDGARYRETANPAVKVFTGDAANLPDVQEAMNGVDVVISCLGNTKKQTIMQASHSNILRAARTQAKIPRCIFLSSVGCGGTSWFIKKMLQLIGGRVSFADYEAADKQIRETTDVPFLLIRAYALNNKPATGEYFVTRKQQGTFLKSISRADVATFILDSVLDIKWDGPPGILLGGK